MVLSADWGHFGNTNKARELMQVSANRSDSQNAVLNTQYQALVRYGVPHRLSSHQKPKGEVPSYFKMLVAIFNIPFVGAFGRRMGVIFFQILISLCSQKVSVWFLLPIQSTVMAIVA